MTAMGRKSRQEYLRTQRSRYAPASRAEKTGILNEGRRLVRHSPQVLDTRFQAPSPGRGACAGTPPRRYDPKSLAPILKRFRLPARVSLAQSA